MSYSEYTGKRVVVTGCSSGIGLATAVALIGLGAEVIGISRRRPSLNLSSFHPVDLTIPDTIDVAAAKLAGTIDALFNCAGAPPHHIVGGPGQGEFPWPSPSYRPRPGAHG